MSPFMLAVAGGSGSGKTTFVKKLLAELADFEVLVVHQDHYYRDLSRLAPADRDLVNFDHPDAIERDLFLQHIQSLRSGKICARPTYDFATHTRAKDCVELKPTSIIVIDGIFSLCDDRLFPLLDLKLYVDAEQDLRLSRRIQRDITERGRNLAGTFKQYFDTVKPMHAQFIEPTKYRSDFIVPWRDYNPGAVKFLGEMIRSVLRNRK